MSTDSAIFLSNLFPILNFIYVPPYSTKRHEDMKIIIIGAGELGQLLAERLSSARNDVTIIDVSKEGFARIHEKLDVMTLAGDATNVKIMEEAGIQKADMLLAVSLSRSRRTSIEAGVSPSDST